MAGGCRGGGPAQLLARGGDMGIHVFFFEKKNLNIKKNIEEYKAPK
jgi:hypothetical protein